MFDIGIICVSLKALFDLLPVVFSVALSFFHHAIIRYYKFVTWKYLASKLFINFSSPGRQQTTHRTKNKHRQQTIKKEKHIVLWKH